MKKALFVLAAISMGASAFAQGTIVFANRNVGTASGTGGGNGNGTYNIPIWEFQKTGTGPAGLAAGGVTVGLFAPGANDASTPLATTLLRTDALPSLNASFFATGSQTVTIPSSDAGTTPTLVVRAWQGAGPFAAARDAGRQYGDWSFTTRPLGGTPAGGGLPITPPGMTGWGPEDGTGLTLTVVPEPSTIALGALGLGALIALRRRK
jgi:hypothetical protein